MERLTEWIRRLRYLLNRRRIEAALREQMDAHRELMGEAVRFGNTQRLREESRDVWGWRWLDDLARDVRLGLRGLRRSPAFTLAALAMLSVGVGVNLSLFQFVNATILRPLPVRDPDSLVAFTYRGPGFMSTGVPYPVAQAAATRSEVLSAVLTSHWAALSWRELDDASIGGQFVSSNWFDELGAVPAAGRLLHAGADDLATAPVVVVLGHRFWQQRFGGDPGVVGRTVHLNGHSALVAGVARPEFPDLGGTRAAFWVPIEQIDRLLPSNDVLTTWQRSRVQMYARLAARASAESARDAMAAMLEQLAGAHPDAIQPGSELDPIAGTFRFRSPEAREQAWLTVASVSALTLIVLFVTCLNVNNLTLARAISRLREMSIRTALGAGRWRVMRLLAVESTLLAAGGTVGGWALGTVASVTIASAADSPAMTDFGLDWRLFATVSALALVVTLAIGLAPAWKVGRRDLAPSARDGADQGRYGTRARQWLVAGQIAGCGVLLVVAGQTWRGFERAIASSTTYDISRLVVLQPAPASLEAAGGPETFWPAARAIVDALPDVERTSIVDGPPLARITSTTSYAVLPEVDFQIFRVDSGYFATMGLPLVAGRPFRPDDDPATAVIISRRGALAVYGTTDVAGRHFPEGTSSKTVVGVAADANLASAPSPDLVQLYQPLIPGRAGALLVRARTDPAALVPSLRSAARAVDARVIPEIRLLEDDLGEALRQPRLASTIAGLSGALALSLALLGIFGVVAFSVRQRVKEIGIRLALGASARAVLGALLRYTFWSGAAGLAIGLALGSAAGGLFAGQPYFLQRLDAPAFVAIGLLVAATGTLAALLPAWRALRQDPLRALRQD